GSVTVVDTTGPDVSAITASRTTLWPPNHLMVDIELTYGASDNCGSVSCEVSVSSSEATNGSGDGSTEPDWLVVDAHHVRLRSERAGPGDGRTYPITVTCPDRAGNKTAKSVTVFVPHDQ